MPFDPRSLLLFGTNALLLFIVLLVNSALSTWALYVLILGPMIVLPALYLRLRACFLCLILSGLWVDAALPSTFGLLTGTFLVCGTAIYMVRVRFRAEQNYHPVLLAHAGNLVCLLALTVFEGRAQFGAPSFWLQVVTTGLLSHLALFFIAPWFFNLQRLLFEICRLETEPVDLPIL
jgi:hypothetical protein